MPNVHGIEFNANQSELVKDLVRELLKDGNCAVYALDNMKPNGELRMASTPPAPTPREVGGVFLRIRPGEREAIIVRPMNAKAGEKYIPVSKLTQAQTLAVIRTWRKQTGSLPIQLPTAPAGPQLVIPAGKKKTTTVSNASPQGPEHRNHHASRSGPSIQPTPAPSPLRRGCDVHSYAATYRRCRCLFSLN